MSKAIHKLKSLISKSPESIAREIDKKRSGLLFERDTAQPTSNQSLFKRISPLLPRLFVGNRSFRLEDIAAAYPATAKFIPLSKSPHKDVRELAKYIEQYSSCPIALDAGDKLPSDQWDKLEDLPIGTGQHEPSPKSRERPTFECPDCGWPTHSSKEYWELDHERHGLVCNSLRQWTEDEHDLRSGRLLWELNFPGRQKENSLLNFTDWNHIMVTRQFSKPILQSPASQRHISRLLTYPYTIASMLSKPWFYYNANKGKVNDVVTDSGWHLLSSLSHAIDIAVKSANRDFDLSKNKVRFTNEPTAPTLMSDPFRIFILGASIESSLMANVWEQLSFIFPGAPFRLYFIGPQATLDPSTIFMGNGDPKNKFQYVTASSRQVRNRNIKVRIPRWYRDGGEPPSSEEEEEDVSKYIDATVPSCAVSLSINMRMEFIPSFYHHVHDTFGPFKRNRDVFVLMNSGVGHPFTKESWKPTIEKVLKTRCLAIFTSANEIDLKKDREVIQEDFEGKYQVVMRPTLNRFSSMSFNVPIDCLHKPEQWYYANRYIFALQGTGTDVGMRRDDFELLEDEEKPWWKL